MDVINGNQDGKSPFSWYGSKLIYKDSSPYQKIYVKELSEYEGIRGKFRTLQFSYDSIQGVKNLEQPQSLVLSYIRIIVDLINHFVPDFKKGFIIGHGIGTVSSYYSDKIWITAEIDPMVVEVSKKYFGHSGNNVVVGDGQVLLRVQEAQFQDIILLDAFSGIHIPEHLTTKEFFSLTNEKLSDKGILIVNYIGSVIHDQFMHSLYRAIAGIYPSVKVFAADPHQTAKQNIIFVASRRNLGDYVPQEAFPFQFTNK